jgi:hypothetical protein
MSNHPTRPNSDKPDTELNNVRKTEHNFRLSALLPGKSAPFLGATCNGEKSRTLTFPLSRRSSDFGCFLFLIDRASQTKVEDLGMGVRDDTRRGSASLVVALFSEFGSLGVLI